jgi:uncharacterized protein YbjT (DUF2867 family)
MKVAVAGGTGLMGSLVVGSLRAAGHEPVILSRTAGVDLRRWLDPDRLYGASRLIDVTNIRTTRKGSSIRFFETATRNLFVACRRAGIRHHVALSVVGAQQVDFGYYFGKRRQEELVLDGPVPSTLVRSTQFYEFARQLVARSGPVVLVPKMLCRPVAAQDVADLLVATVLGDPAGRIVEIAGPEDRQMVDMVRSLIEADGPRRLVVPVKLPGAAGDGMTGGGLLPTGPGPRGTETFDQWLVRGTARPVERR